MSESPEGRRRFTLAEANALLPEVRRLTDEAKQQVEEIAARMETSGRSGARRAQLEASLGEAITRWTQAIGELGLEAKGLWLVDFDAGDGYYCWKHPEPAIAHYHGYTEGFAGRMKIV